MLRDKTSSLDGWDRSIGFITVTAAGRDPAPGPSDLHTAISVTVTRSEIKDFFIPSLDFKLTGPDEFHLQVPRERTNVIEDRYCHL